MKNKIVFGLAGVIFLVAMVMAEPSQDFFEDGSDCVTGLPPANNWDSTVGWDSQGGTCRARANGDFQISREINLSLRDYSNFTYDWTLSSVSGGDNIVLTTYVRNSSIQAWQVMGTHSAQLSTSGSEHFNLEDFTNLTATVQIRTLMTVTGSPRRPTTRMDNYNVSSFIGGAPEDPCGTPSGSANWDIDCSTCDNLDAEYDLNEYNITFSNAGTVIIGGNISNIDVYRQEKTCNVLLHKGGSLR